MNEKIKKAIEVLIAKIDKETSAGDALQLTQAVSNLINCNATVESK